MNHNLKIEGRKLFSLSCLLALQGKDFQRLLIWLCVNPCVYDYSYILKQNRVNYSQPLTY